MIDVDVIIEPLEIDFEDFVDEPTEAIAEVVRDSIRAQSDNRWNKTGHLLSGIQASNGEVTAPSDRLTRPDLVERFAAEVLPDDPMTDRRVIAAAQSAMDRAVK